MAIAACAAAMAASPWPRPSTTASNTPSMVGWIRCRSPEATSPGDGRLATPQAINGVEMTLSSCIATDPFFHGDGRADADFGNDVEIVHQQFRSGQTHTQPSARGVDVLHGLRDIGYARPAVARDDGEAAPVAVVRRLENDFPTLRVLHDVARDFGDGGGDEGQVRALKTQLHRQRTALLTRRYNVRLGGDRHPRFIWRHADSSWFSDPGTPALLRGPGPCRCLRASTPIAPSQTPLRAGCRR